MSSPLYITSRTDWTPGLIEQVYRECEKIGTEEMGLSLYPNQVEIISAEQMLDAYASIGMPVNYNHWSFGKEFLRNEKAYRSGRQNLAYEIVINAAPCISYLMEENTMLMQTMVIAHAAVGHNSVFKNNICFKQWTNAGSIIDYMVFARDFIRRCEQRYGVQEVEGVLDAAHALAPHSVDKFKRKHRPRMTEETRLRQLIEEDERRQRELDVIMKKTSMQIEEEHEEDSRFEEEENLLYFIMKRSPSLETWKREILRIVWKINQYFYPQSQTQNLNEGMASFCHYHIMTRLEEKGIISPDGFMAFLHSHSSVIYQPTYQSPYYSGLNPYALGFAICQDIKRVCEAPTAEDKEWFPQLIGKKWQDAVQEAVFEHRDDSFVAQYLSPKVIRDLRLFSVGLKHTEDEDLSAKVTEIHDDIGFRALRTNLATSLERINRVPQIAVVGADLEGDRTLRLKYTKYKGRDLDTADAEAVVDHIDTLWGYAVSLEDA
jgi:stage V sporulation protein R